MRIDVVPFGGDSTRPDHAFGDHLLLSGSTISPDLPARAARSVPGRLRPTRGRA